jgi:hypothetical protein
MFRMEAGRLIEPCSRHRADRHKGLLEEQRKRRAIEQARRHRTNESATPLKRDAALRAWLDSL